MNWASNLRTFSWTLISFSFSSIVHLDWKTFALKNFLRHRNVSPLRRVNQVSIISCSVLKYCFITINKCMYFSVEWNQSNGPKMCSFNVEYFVGFRYRVHPNHTWSERGMNWNLMLDWIVKPTTSPTTHTSLSILDVLRFNKCV